MERKLIAHGLSSLTVALPYKWIAKHSLKKGDSVAVEETESGILVSANHTKRQGEIIIDISDSGYSEIHTFLTMAYRRGYDKVALKYETSQQYSAVSDTIRNLLGYAILDINGKKLTVNSLSIEKNEDFNIILKRVYYIILQELSDLVESVKKGENLSEFYKRDQDVNTLVNLGIRMISKGYIQDRFEELHVFYLLLLLEEVGDDILKLSVELQNKTFTKAVIAEGLEHAAKFTRMLFDAYFKKDQSILSFYKKYYIYFPEEKGKKSPEYYDFFTDAERKKEPVFYLRTICERIVSLAEILVLPEVKNIV